MRLTENELQYVVAFLFIVSRETALQNLVVGDRILDVATGTERDVDVVALAAGDVGLIAAEVKDEARPLGSPEVEQLAMKLNDMPALKRRLVVSASGFTEPALRKAKHHGIICLQLVRGPLPWHSQVDLSELTSLTVARRSFVSPANVTLDLKDTRGSEPAPSSAPPGVEVRFASGEAPMKFQEFTDWVAKGVLDLTETEGPVDRRVEFLDGPTMTANCIEYSILSAEVAGSVRVSSEKLPLHDSCYLQDEGGEPFASTCIFDVDGTLYGLSTAKSELRMFMLPPELRRTRPYKQTLRFETP